MIEGRFVDDVYEEPTDADITVDTSKQTIPEIVHCEYTSRSIP